jgi:hypothetical protein
VTVTLAPAVGASPADAWGSAIESPRTVGAVRPAAFPAAPSAGAFSATTAATAVIATATRERESTEPERRASGVVAATPNDRVSNPRAGPTESQSFDNTAIHVGVKEAVSNPAFVLPCS